MDIIIVFEGTSIVPTWAPDRHQEQFKAKITEAWKNINSTQSNDEIYIHTLMGNLPDAMPGEKVRIIISNGISNARGIPNIGKLIVEFKKNAIQAFLEYGINVNADTLRVKSQPIEDVQAFIRQGQIMNISRKKEDKAVETPKQPEIDEFDYKKKAKQYIPVEPLYSFDRVILPKEVREKIEHAIGILQCENKVFKEWGLYEIQPHPSTSLSFYGPSGTGKTMAAEAIAHKLGKKILRASYADVESKYHGEGPKMIKAIFLAAQDEDAVLFFDEADSLLSKRLTSVTQGSEQAINSMRSQLLICLEEFRGIAIFATNLVVNYDNAFLTRLISVEFTIPDVETRKKIWDVHIRPINDGRPHQLNIPLGHDVDTDILAERYDFAGREIRNAVVAACVSAALAGRNVVNQEDFTGACEKIEKEKMTLATAKDYTNLEPSDFIKKAMEEKINRIKTEQ